jgi:hypothetical protein
MDMKAIIFGYVVNKCTVNAAPQIKVRVQFRCVLVVRRMGYCPELKSDPNLFIFARPVMKSKFPFI